MGRGMWLAGGLEPGHEQPWGSVPNGPWALHWAKMQAGSCFGKNDLR